MGERTLRVHTTRGDDWSNPPKPKVVITAIYVEGDLYTEKVKVGAKFEDGRSAKRVQTFRAGDFMWQDANRYFADCASEYGDFGVWPDLFDDLREQRLATVIELAMEAGRQQGRAEVEAS